MSKHAVLILLAGVAANASYLWGKYDSYLQGRALNGIHSVDSFFMTFAMLGVGFCLLLAGAGAIYRGIAKKRWQPLIACAVVPLMCVATSFVPMPSHLQGMAETLSAKDEAFYVDIAGWLRKRAVEKGDQDTPDGLFQRFPGLVDLFPSEAAGSGKIRFNPAAGYTDVWTGGSHGGFRGFRVYGKEGESPYPKSGEYVGSFRLIHPRVYAFERHF